MGKLETNSLFKEELSRSSILHHLTDEETQEVKKIIFETTVDIVNICNRLDIPYMLGGGSALGAVRHKGFIPWDDDIDLNIPRAYIGTLRDEIHRIFPEKYQVIEPVKTRGYLSSFIQVQRLGTVFQEYRYYPKEMCGIKVDIFVIENTYDNPIRRRWHGFCCELGLFMLSCYRMHAWRDEFKELAKDSKKAKLLIGIKGAIGLAYAVAPGYWYRRVQRCLSRCKDENSKYVVIPSGRNHFFGELYEREPFMKTKLMDFETEKFAVTEDYDNYLSRLYGDYMTIPKEAKREAHIIYDFKLKDGPMLLDRRSIQLMLVDMLDEFVAYCDKHNLRYYFVGGTLLGAVRHKGFIPWDDDIDVGMPRPDYDRFLELIKTEPVADHLKAVSSKNGDFTMPYCELIHTGTKLERATSSYINSKHQVLNLFIDIFPQDGWPEDEKEAMAIVKKMKKERYNLQNARALLGKGTSRKRAILKAPMIIMMRIRGIKRILRDMDRVALRIPYDDAKYVGAITYGIYGLGERCLHDQVVDFTKVEFEGKEYNAPGCIDSYLSGIYGDYMKLPPVEKQKNHRMKVWINVD